MSAATVRAALQRALDGGHLTEDEARALLSALVDPEVPDALKAGVLVALRSKGETAEEIRGLALAMRDLAVPVPLCGDGPLVDTCGTGGDASGSVNVSTGAALLLAACGVRVAKHGNRAQTSQAGSADVLLALGLVLPTGPEAAHRLLEETGFTFLLAPTFHPSTAAVGPARRALGVRTAFNLLGPLTNPARPDYQLIGAFSANAALLIAGALAGMGGRGTVVHGAGGWDEATPIGPFQCWIAGEGLVADGWIDPLDLGIGRCAPSDLQGGDAAVNAALLWATLGGKTGPIADALALNAALVLAGALEIDLAAAVSMARSALADGRAAERLERIVQASRDLAHG